MPELKTSTFETSIPIEQRVEFARDATLSDTIARTYQQCDSDVATVEPTDPSQQYRMQHDYTLLVGLEAAAVVELTTEAGSHPGVLAEISEAAAAVTQVLVTEAAVRRCVYAQALLGKDDLMVSAYTMLGKLHQSHLSRIFGPLEQEEQRLHELAMSNLCASYLGHGNCDQAVIDTAKVTIPRQLRDEEKAFNTCMRSQRLAKSRQRVRGFGQALLRACYHRKRFSPTAAS